MKKSQLKQIIKEEIKSRNPSNKIIHDKTTQEINSLKERVEALEELTAYLKWVLKK